MPGGLLNIIGVGQQDVILTGNPTKTFWKSNYSKYTNFGMQKFRLEYDGQKTISLTNKSQFTFKFKRYGDLVADTYLGFNLPHIWSPLHKYTSKSKKDGINYYLPYEFQWIKHLGTQLIKSIEVNVGGQTLQKYSGEYLTTMIERDFDKTKQELINRMTGNLPEFNDPANAFQRNGRYPNAVYNKSPGGAEPSIRGRTLYIPLNAWFNLNTKQAFPLVSLQYNELTVTVTLRPIYELFTIRDLKNPGDNYPHIAPNFNDSYQEMYNFLQSPPLHTNELNKNINIWNADIHLISTYVFLGEDERRLFATQPQEYLIHDIHETTFDGISINERLDLKSMGLVSSWMWFARRDDAYKRNQWTNYTNWDYEGIMPSASRIPPIYDPKFNATHYLVTPSNETIKSNEQEAGYLPPSVYMLQSDETIIPGNTKAGNIIPVFEQQGSTDISNFTVGYQPPNLRTLQSDISYTEHMLPTFRQQGAHRDPSHIGYNPPSISIIEKELSAENIALDIKPIWNEQGANSAGCAKCSDPAPTPIEPVTYPPPTEPVPYTQPMKPVTYSPPMDPVPSSFRLMRNDKEELSYKSFVNTYNKLYSSISNLNNAGVFFKAINHYYGDYCYMENVSGITDNISNYFKDNLNSASVSYTVTDTLYTYNNPIYINESYDGIPSSPRLMYNKKNNTMIFHDNSFTYFANNVVYNITEISYNIQFMLNSSDIGNYEGNNYTWTWVDSIKDKVTTDFSFNISPFIYTPIIYYNDTTLINPKKIPDISGSGWDNIIIPENIFTNTHFKSTPIKTQFYPTTASENVRKNSFPWGFSGNIDQSCTFLETTNYHITKGLSYIHNYETQVHQLFHFFKPHKNTFKIDTSYAKDSNIIQQWNNGTIIIKLIKLSPNYYFYDNTGEKDTNPYYASVASASGYMMSHYLEHVNTEVLALHKQTDLSYLSSNYASNNYDSTHEDQYMYVFYNMDTGFHTDIRYNNDNTHDLSDTISEYNTTSGNNHINITNPCSDIIWETSSNDTSTNYHPDISNRRDDKFAFMWSVPFIEASMNHINTYNFIDYSADIPEVSSITFTIQNDNKLLPDLVEVNMYSLDPSFEYRITYDLLNKSTESEGTRPNNIPSGTSNLFTPNILQYYDVSGEIPSHKGRQCPNPTHSTDPIIYISDTNYLTQMPVPHNNTWVFCQHDILDNTPVVSTNLIVPTRYNSVVEFSSNRSTLGSELDISYGIFNKDVMNGIKWTPICINLSAEVLTSYEVLTRINSTLLDVQKHLGSDQSIYIQYFSSNSIRVDISINTLDTLRTLHTLHKFINTISCDTSLVVDNIAPYSVDGSNGIIHHIIYGISDDSSLISNATIETPNILDGSHTFVSKFIDISKVEYFGENILVPNHNTYIYITPKVYHSNSPEPEYNLAIFDKEFSNSYTAPAIPDSANNYDSVFNDFDSVFNDSNSVNDSIFRNNTVSSQYINTNTGRYSTRTQRPTRLPTRGQVIKQPVNYFTPNTIDIFSSDTTVNVPAPVPTPVAAPTDPFINYWGGNNCPFSFSTTGVYTVKNTKNIMTTAGIIVDGKYRENLMDEGIYNYIEKYTRTSGAAKDGLYCYNYTLDTNPTNVQPTGSINYSRFKKIELELTTISPPLNKDNTFSTICRKDERTQLSEQIGVVQLYDNNFKYRFEIVFMEERYNIIKFIGGNVGLVFSN